MCGGAHRDSNSFTTVGFSMYEDDLLSCIHVLPRITETRQVAVLWAIVINIKEVEMLRLWLESAAHVLTADKDRSDI